MVTPNVVQENLISVWKDFQKGITLDKLFGGSYRQIDISSMESSSDEFYLPDSVTKKKDTFQQTFEIKETDGEDEEYHDVKKKITHEIIQLCRPPLEQSNLFLTFEPKLPKLDGECYSSMSEIKTIEVNTPEFRPYFSRPKLILTNTPGRKISQDINEEVHPLQNLKDFIEKSPYSKPSFPQNRSPVAPRVARKTCRTSVKKLSMNLPSRHPESDKQRSK